MASAELMRPHFRDPLASFGVPVRGIPNRRARPKTPYQVRWLAVAVIVGYLALLAGAAYLFVRVVR